MIKNKIFLSALSVSILFVGACADMQDNPKRTVGTVGGAIAGGVIGAQFGGGTGQLIATGAGAMLGGMLGGELGRQLDEADKMKLQQASIDAQSANIGQEILWNNPDSGNYGSVTPVRDGTSADGRYCREYKQDVTIDGKSSTAYGTACQNPDGTWQVSN